MVVSGNRHLQSPRELTIKQALQQGKPYKEIASQYRVSFRDISKVAKEMYEPSPFDVFEMVAKGMNPIEIADKTGAEFAEVKTAYKESVELLELVSKHSTALEQLRGTELYGKLKQVIDRKEERKQLAKVSAKYVCERCGEPLLVEDLKSKCPKCGHTKYEEV